MQTFLRWLRRIPFGLWVFIAATQLVTIAARLNELPKLDETFAELQASRVDSELLERFDDVRKAMRFDLKGALILAPLTLVLAYWKWSVEREQQSIRSGTNASPQSHSVADE